MQPLAYHPVTSSQSSPNISSCHRVETDLAQTPPAPYRALMAQGFLWNSPGGSLTTTCSTRLALKRFTHQEICSPGGLLIRRFAHREVRSPRGWALYHSLRGSLAKRLALYKNHSRRIALHKDRSLHSPASTIWSRSPLSCPALLRKVPSPRESWPEAFYEPSCEPSCEENGSCEASCEPSDDIYIHVKVHVKIQMNLSLHMKVHVKLSSPDKVL